MIKVYKLKIGEKVYEVELEDVSEKQGSIEQKSAPVQEVKKETTEKVTSNSNDKVVEAPMQGTILSLTVSVGDKISEGDEILILEAMKMENPILAPYSGTITEICVAKGDNVEDGTVLVKIS